MNAFLSQTRLGLVLAMRNRIGLVYGFLFPLLFLAAFAVIYRHEEAPLALHLGELLTVTLLGGACFGLPTTLVNERERGVWRRYRLTPVPTVVFVASTVTARLVLVFAASLLQIGVALAAGMPMPSDPAGLLLAFTVAAATFLAMGMVIAQLAPNVPAVQALGQCIFLPMLLIGGVGVRLTSLPDWALQASAFFPGRYAVTAMQRSVTGAGQGGGAFELLCLLSIAAASGLAAVALFRWDSAQRVRLRNGGIGLLLALGVWGVVGVAAQWRGKVSAAEPVLEHVGTVGDFLAPRPVTPALPPFDGTQSPTTVAESPTTVLPAPAPAPSPAATAMPPSMPAPAPAPTEPASWHEVAAVDFKRIAFERLPPDEGLITPIARTGEIPDPAVTARLEQIRGALRAWPPVQIEDVVQRARNALYVAALPDLLQMGEIERHLPQIVFDHLKGQVPYADLQKILYWIAMHPDEGDDSALGQLDALGLPNAPGPTRAVRARAMIYAFKLLGRMSGDIASAPTPVP